MFWVKISKLHNLGEKKTLGLPALFAQFAVRYGVLRI